VEPFTLGDVDVVVVNYRTPYDLKKCMETLSAYPPSEPSTLTVVDVASNNRNVAFKSELGDAVTIGTSTNIGYGRACNLAATRGADEIIGFFNADVEFTPDALDRCIEALTSNDDWAILGPCQIDERNLIRHAGIFGSLERPKHRGWNTLDYGQYSDVRDAVTVSGSAFFIKRKVWVELTDCPLFQHVAPDAQGAFLPTPHYYEETWASYHAQAHGYRVVYYGPVTLIHKWHRASKVGGWAEKQMPKSRKIFRHACDAHGIPHD
jgi:GT2 family glycosyltransferase